MEAARESCSTKDFCQNPIGQTQALGVCSPSGPALTKPAMALRQRRCQQQSTQAPASRAALTPNRLECQCISLAAMRSVGSEQQTWQQRFWRKRTL